MKDFLFTLLAWLLTLPFIVAAVTFAVFNDQAVPIIANPLHPPVLMPVYVPVLVAIGFGFLFGSVMTWAGMGKLRKDRRDQKKRIRDLEKKLEASNQNSGTPHNYSMVPRALLEKY